MSLTFKIDSELVIDHYDGEVLAAVAESSTEELFFCIAVGPSDQWPGGVDTTWIMCFVPVLDVEVAGIVNGPNGTVNDWWRGEIRRIMGRAQGYYLQDRWSDEPSRFYPGSVPEDFKPNP